MCNPIFGHDGLLTCCTASNTCGITSEVKELCARHANVTSASALSSSSHSKLSNGTTWMAGKKNNHKAEINVEF